MKITYYLAAFIFLTLTSCRKTLLVDSNVVIDTEAFHSRPMGSSASELLADSIYKALVVEVQYVAGFKPEDVTINHLSSFLETYLNKPKGIKIVLNEIPAIADKALSMEEVSTIEKEKRTRFVQQDTMTIYVLFTNGTHPGNKILGMAYRNTSAVVYGKAIRKYSSMKGRLTHHELETAVVLHEIGHLLGLINKGSAPQSKHIDPEFPDHCNNRKCLMFHSVETRNLSSTLLTGNIPLLDEHCIEDLVANGGRNVPDYRPFIKPFSPEY
jgi:predicted Zn-dependent protease